MKYNSRRGNNTASISSLQSFETIRQAPSTAATSIAASDDHRWSDVVPPDSGLKFAVVWDPEQKDLVTFSSAELANSRDARSPNSPSDAFDNRSQVLTIGPSAIPPSEYTGTSQFFRQDHNYRFAESKFFPDRPTRGRTQTSSTLDGLDVYLRGSMLGKAHNANRFASCFQDLDGDFAFDPRTSFAQAWLKYMKDGIRDDVSDEGFFESGPSDGMGGENEGNMSSAFSVTTTSTSNYIDVENEMSDDESANWSALEAPNTPGYASLFFTGQSPAPTPNRRLHKSRPPPRPAPPSDVLERDYSYNVPQPALARPEPQRSQTLPATPPTPALTDAHAGGHSPRAQPLHPLNAQPPQVCARIGQIQKAGTTRLGLDRRQRKGRVRFITLVVVSLPHIASATFRSTRFLCSHSFSALLSVPPLVK
ncbi:hypothetical protein C8F04DRAFT_1257839 [Mycena alexandri]|uniref:Uncharacterized protein n=1 Tax=Mycena alexandri TaxID=1745969 RepID=A0AAD6T170_9AGAR|nr:hypothetical protein C8F04DRAFT_1257839 [Mycena alexandri]